MLSVRVDRFAACDGESGSFTGFEDASIHGSDAQGSTTTLVGTLRSERLGASGHSVVVRAGAGRDEIRVEDSWVARVHAGVGGDRVAASGDDVVLHGQGGSDTLKLWGSAGRRQPPGVQRQRIARGGPGNDVLAGATDGLPDRLVGGAGRDRADGRGGPRDVCSAEETRRCERS